MKSYNPSDVGIKGSIFGYPYSVKDSEMILIPVPWDATVSYRAGTSLGPTAILEASPQLDLSLHHIAEPWTYSCAMMEQDPDLAALNASTRPIAERVIDALEKGSIPESKDIDIVNSSCQQMIDFVYVQSKQQLKNGRTVGIVGGDHSTPLGLIRALAEEHEFGILQIDAHMDLRNAYEGFEYSHASIMYHAINTPNVKSITQVGIRDFCEEELQFIQGYNKHIHTYYDDQIKEGQMVGESWSDWVQNIVAKLPRKVYISFDIDGLLPNLCSNTGTPVPGGLSFAEVNYLLKKVVSAGRRIIGFDLCEVAPGNGDWDANVGARILYRLVTMTGLSQGKLKALL
jgi:agmatinase